MSKYLSEDAIKDNYMSACNMRDKFRSNAIKLLEENKEPDNVLHEIKNWYYYFNNAEELKEMLSWCEEISPVNIKPIITKDYLLDRKAVYFDAANKSEDGSNYEMFELGNLHAINCLLKKFYGDDDEKTEITNDETRKPKQCKDCECFVSDKRIAPLGYCENNARFVDEYTECLDEEE